MNKVELFILAQLKESNETLNPNSNFKSNELKPDDMTTERLNSSNNPDDKSDFHTEQIDSPLTSKRDSEEWEGASHKEIAVLMNESPENTLSKAVEIEIESLNNDSDLKKPQKKVSSRK